MTDSEKISKANNEALAAETDFIAFKDKLVARGKKYEDISDIDLSEEERAELSRIETALALGRSHTSGVEFI